MKARDLNQFLSKDRPSFLSFSVNCLKKKMHGTSLIELLISMTLSLILLPPLIGFFTSWQNSYRNQSDFSNDLHDLRASMEFMVRDIRNIYKLLEITETSLLFVSKSDTVLLSHYSSDSNSLNTLIDDSQNWSENQWRDYAVMINQGTGKGQAKKIIGNTSNQLTVEPNWSTLPETDSEYHILKRRGFSADAGDQVNYLYSGEENKILLTGITSLSFTPDNPVPDTKTIEIYAQSGENQLKTLLSLRN